MSEQKQAGKIIIRHKSYYNFFLFSSYIAIKKMLRKLKPSRKRDAKRSKASKYCCSLVFLFFVKNSANLDFFNTQISKNHTAETEIVRHLLEHEW